MSNIKQGYKQTDIGVIPEDWEVKPIKQIFDICNNQRLPISEEIRKKMQGIFPYYGPTKIQDYINEYRLEGEYALIGEDGDHFLKWKDMAMTQLTSGKFNVNNHAHIIKGRNNVTTTKWFYYFFKNRDITGFLARQGAGRYKLSKATLSEIPCAYPTRITEQTAIATALSDTDALIAALDKKIAKKQQIKQGAMQQLLTGKKRLPGFSGEWVEKELKKISNMNSGGTPNSNNPNYYNGEIPFLSISDISKSGKYIKITDKTITKLGLENSSARLFSAGTIMYAMYASVGKCSISNIEISCSQAILGITVNENTDSEFLYYYLSFIQNEILSFTQTGTQSNLSKGIVENFVVYIPNNKVEQTAIAQILTDMDNEIAQLEKERDKYKELKAGMMQVLLTGKVRLV